VNLHVPELLAIQLRQLAHEQSETCARLGVAAVVSPTRVAHQLLAAGIAHAKKQREGESSAQHYAVADAAE